jgi:hypothetical protein
MILPIPRQSFICIAILLKVHDKGENSPQKGNRRPGKLLKIVKFHG